MNKTARLILESGEEFHGTSFGYSQSVAGEVVFNTGMVGYPETFTDPSYYGQILVMTYPLLGNYGVASFRNENGITQNFESHKAQLTALIVSEHSNDFSHWSGSHTLFNWLKENKVPALAGINTRRLTKLLREHGTMLGKIIIGDKDIEYYDPDKDDLISKVTVKEPVTLGSGDKRVLLVDCGCKNSIAKNLIARGVEILRVPWHHDFTKEEYDGVVLSNGPGDPAQYTELVKKVKSLLKDNKPVLGICLGHQMLSCAAGAKTEKLKYGHRSQNQPVKEEGTNNCFVTSQNHGFSVVTESIPKGWKPWFVNLNDGTNEGIIHGSKPFFSVQFHPEAMPGPVDTSYIFDKFIKLL